MGSEWLTIAECSRRFGRSRSHLWGLCRDGLVEAKIVTGMPGKGHPVRWLVSVDSLQEYLAAPYSSQPWQCMELAHLMRVGGVRSYDAIAERLGIKRLSVKRLAQRAVKRGIISKHERARLAGVGMAV